MPVNTDSPPPQIALAYFDAWTSKNINSAMTYIAEDIVCEAPVGCLEGTEAYRGVMEPFTQILQEAKMLAAFGDERTALLMYNTRTLPVPSAPASEYVTVTNGKITHSRFIFDRAPFIASSNTD